MTQKELSITRQRLKYVVSDFLTTSIAFLIFDVCRFYILYDEILFNYSLKSYLCMPKMLGEQILIPLSLLAVYWLSGYYNRPFDKSRLNEFLNTSYTALFNTILIFFILLIDDRGPIVFKDYLLIFILFLLLWIFTYSGRLLITTTSRKNALRKNLQWNTVVIGTPQLAEKTMTRLSQVRTLRGYNFLRFIDINRLRDGVNSLDFSEIDNIVEICKTRKADQVIIASDSGNDKIILELLYRLYPLDIPVKIIPDTLSYITPSIRLTDILAEPLIDLSSPPLSDCSSNIKIVFDKLISFIALIILSPLMMALAIMVKRSSAGPVFYRQERIGKRGKPFTIYKFRSMYPDAESSGPMLSSDNDNRITDIGKVMRKYRLDELPQFWNVLKGDMSIVGPRPERDFYIRRIIEKAPYYSLVFQVKPGITSWGMVKFGYASNVAQMVERTKYDLIYITNMSLALDLKIIIYTVRTIVKGSGM